MDWTSLDWLKRDRAKPTGPTGAFALGPAGDDPETQYLMSRPSGELGGMVLSEMSPGGLAAIDKPIGLDNLIEGAARVAVPVGGGIAGTSLYGIGNALKDEFGHGKYMGYGAYNPSTPAKGLGAFVARNAGRALMGGGAGVALGSILASDPAGDAVADGLSRARRTRWLMDNQFPAQGKYPYEE